MTTTKANASIKSNKDIEDCAGLDDKPCAVKVESLTVSYGPTPVLLDATFCIKQGTLVGIIGPNGAGKSTMIKSILGFMKPDFGSVGILGKPVRQQRGAIAYVPQRGSVDWDFPVTVREVALMGRYKHMPWYKSAKHKDWQAADEALELVNMSEFADRQIGQLSGGQQQRVFIARALAQDSPVMLLDEPFAGVDAATENAILSVLQLMKEKGRTLVVVHHDLASASEYFDKLLLVKQRVFGYGDPDRVLNPELLSKVYGGKLRVFDELGKGQADD